MTFPPQSSDARKLRSAKKKLREKLEHLLCIRKQEAEVNEEAMDTDTQSSSQVAEVNEEEMDTDTQSSSSSLCKVSTDKNVNACSMEPLDEKQMLQDIKRELAKDLNNDLIEGYRTCGISNDALKELKSNGLRALSEEVPLLEFFNIPLVPGIIRKVLQNIVKLSCLFPDVELMSYDTYGGDHKNVIFSMPQASSRESFMKKGSQDIICNIPKRLVNTSQFEEIENGVERNGAIKKAEFKRKRWIIESLVRQDVMVKGIIKDIAREELGMVVMTKGMT
jgi:hypothetical protein